VKTLGHVKLRELDKLFHLLEEMTEITDMFLIWLLKYCKEKNIPLHQEQQLKDYVQLSRRLLKEIAGASTDLQRLSDDFLHGDESDEDFTEPVQSIYKRGLVSAEQQRQLPKS